LQGGYISKLAQLLNVRMEDENSENHLVAWTLLVFIAIFALIFANTDEELPSGRHQYREQDDFLDLDDFDS